MRAATARLVVLGGSAVLTLAGCSSTPHDADVRAAAQSFARALEAGNGAAACRMLTTDARKSASGATSTSCSKAIASIHERGSAVSDIQVWGDAAQARLSGDVIFLRLISGRWRISAAGCKPQSEDEPYDCAVNT